MAGKKKYILTPELEVWLREVFPSTNNTFICQKIGCSYGSLRRMVRTMGLKKTPEFKRAIAINANIKSQAACRANGYYDSLKGHPVPNGESTRFVKGQSMQSRLGKELEVLRVESIRKTYKRERARVLYGLPQKTKLRVVKMNRTKANNRHWLLKNGYIRDLENINVLYYTETTYRRPRAEATALKYNTKILPLPKINEYGIDNQS